MTDASLPVKAFNAYDHLSHHAPLAAIHAASHHQQRFHAPKVADVHEDDGQISCICGFQDDDGWTVACDACNKWQHQSCYYPQFDEIQLPDDLAHYCVDCQPRAIDSQSARRRQLGKRDQSEPLTNGAKRLAPTNRKKKTKENGAPQTNGWPVDKLRHDRNSASPRDQGPPAKRPKTSHRASDSTATSTATKGHSRKRNTSTALHRRSLSRSPDSPVEQYSENFLQCYMEDDWAVTDTNLHNSIGITNALSEWLNLPDDEFRSKHSQTKGEVLMRWDGDLNDIPGKAEVDIEDQRDDSITYNGSHPCWKRVTVREPVPTGAYIGELKGHICFKKDYQDESANRWAELRHPEPFVFFHPKLPIVVDARNEGTELRYVRRSCYPNARLQILVTDSVDYHFCFMATQQIEPGEEVAVGWDTNDGLPELALRTKVSDEDMELLTSWVSTALANCGPCACNMAEGECMMSRFDRRVKGLVDDAQVMKVPKSKKRKNGQHISPLNTNALNSRSGSEARKVEPDDDRSDSRSVSGSAGRGSASRDITPNTHYSTNGTIPEMSERERKKLAKEEEMFRRQEEEKAGKQAKKKRNSGGSSLNTPSATSSKQLGFPATAPAKYGDGGISRQGSHSSAKALANKKVKKMQARPAGKVNKRPKPVYVDADTQCDMDEEQAEPPPPRPVARKPTKTLRQRLLERCAKNNHAILSSAPPTPASTPDDKMDVDTSKSEQKSQASSPQTADRPPSSHSATAKQPDTSADADTEMHDAIDDKDGSNTNGHPQPASTMSTDATKQISPSDNPPPPPWAPKTASTGTDACTTTSKPSNMHLQMPPPTTNPFAPPAPPLSSGSNAPGSVVQSPASMGAGPVFSPSVTAAVNPSPARKKLSLSDYTRRKAKKEDAEAKADRESSPASTASGPIVPPLQASSSSEMRAAEGTAIEEDVKMEEAENVPPTAVEPKAA